MLLICFSVQYPSHYLEQTFDDFLSVGITQGTKHNVKSLSSYKAYRQQ